MVSVASSEPPQEGSSNETKQRCRFALKYLHRLVAKLKALRGEPRHHPSFMSSILNQSEFSEIEELAFEHSRKSSDDEVLLSSRKIEDLIKETELWEESIYECTEESLDPLDSLPASFYKNLTDKLA